MSYVIVNRRPDKSYYDYMLWVPKSDPQVEKLKTRTSFLVPAKNSKGFKILSLWRQQPRHVLFPRHIRADVEPIKLIPPFQKIDVRSKITLDYQGTTHQREAIDAWMQAGHGILNLACGKGKTVIALEAIARMKVPTLVIVHTRDLLIQWTNQAKKFLDGVSIGKVQGSPSTWTWKRDVVIGSLQTLVLYQDDIPLDMRGYFGAVIWDEVHHLGAERFSETADLFLGNRFGLSATVFRGDGQQQVYLQHLGPIFYSDLSQQLKPKFYFLATPTKLDFSNPKVRMSIYDRRGLPNIAKTRVYVAMQEDRIEWELKIYRSLRRHGRQVLVLSHSVEHLKTLAARMAETGLCIGTIKSQVRYQALQNHDIVFATTSLAKEGLDREDFDTLVISTPFGGGIDGANLFQQAVGRILRPMSGKNPVVLIFDDIRVPPLHRMVRQIYRMIRTWPADQGGPYAFEYVTPDKLKL